MLANLFFKIRDLIESSPAKRDRLILISMIVSGAANLALWLMTLIVFWHFKDYVVLQYNIYFGISSLGPWPLLLLIPLAGLLFGVLDFALAFALFLKDRLLSYFLSVAATAFNLISLFALILIIYINT